MTKVNTNIKFNPIMTTNKKEISSSEEKTQITQETYEFVDRIRNSSTEEILGFLSQNTEKIPVRNEQYEFYRYKNILLVRSNGENSIELENTLKSDSLKKLTPEFAQYFQLGKNDFLTIIQIHPSEISPYKRLSAGISKEAKQNFKTSVQEMINKGIINKEIFATKNPMFITNDMKNLIFTDWTTVSSISPEEKIIFTQKLKELQL